jgi:hypothetical protein
VVCRIHKPKSVIETGVAAGTSTVGILSALEANPEGVLHSADPPAARYRTDAGEVWQDVSRSTGPGWLVPERLKPRWTLHIGPSRLLSPEILSSLQHIDLFYRDSEHTKPNMDFELDEAVRYLNADGCVLVDNSNWSTSFHDFCRHYSLESIMLFPFLGVIRKPYRAGLGRVRNAV